LNIVDREKAIRELGTLESVTAYTDRFRGRPADSNYFVCCQDQSNDQKLFWMEPVNCVETLDAMIERVLSENRQNQLTVLMGGSINRAEMKLVLGDDADLFKLFARVFGSNHKNGAKLAHLLDARMPDGRTVRENVESHGLECVDR